MTPRITHYLNQQVLVSVPALFEDGLSRSFLLVGVEMHGLWLQSDELTARLLPEEQVEAFARVPVFIPFSQMVAVLMTPPPAPPVPPAVLKRNAQAQAAAPKNKANPASGDAKADTKHKAKPRK